MNASLPRIISADVLREKVQFTHLVEPVAKALAESSAKRAQNGLIVMFPAEHPHLGDVYVKTGVLAGHSVYIVKISPWFAVNVARQQPQGGFIAVFDSETGHTLALLNEEHYLSDIRTAAAGAVAARLFAPAEVDMAAVVGSGVQAYWQPLALYSERPFKRLTIWARDMSKAELLKQRLADTLPKVEIEVSADLERTVRTADVLLTTTLSREPLVKGNWLRSGQHVTAVGADDPTKCELHAAALTRARVFVDSLETNIANGDIGRAIEQGAYAAEQVSGEIGQVLAGQLAGRTSREDITIAKLVGLGAQDLVAAETALGLV